MEFRELRRKKQQLSQSQAEEILQNGKSGILAVLGDGGYPYTVPLNFVFDGGKIYFHCAKAGHKLDAIHRDARVSFCVIAQDDVIAEKFTTYFRSVVAFGKAHELTDDADKLRVIRLLNKKYAPDLPVEGEQEIAQSFRAMTAVEIEIEQLTGNQAMDLARMQQKMQG